MLRSSADGIFLGRDRQLSDFDRVLETLRSSTHPAPRPQIILISGQGGIGKTTLLHAFRDRLGPEGSFRPALLAIDWHEEQKQAPLRFPSVAEQVSAQAVFAAIDRRAASFPEWSKARKSYEQEQERIGKVKVKLERDLASSRSVVTSANVKDVAAKTAGELASLSGLPLVKTLVEALVKLGVDVAPQWVESILAKSGPADLDLIQDFEQYLARGLGRSLATLAGSVASRRLLVFFDTYEIVDERDPLMREVIRAAGPKVGWVIAGRRDLYADRAQTPRGRFDGYVVGEGHDWDLRPIDVRALAKEEIRTFFRQAAPERPALTDEELESIHRATGAIPLAIRLAAEIWKRIGEVEQIVAREEDNAPQETIVEEMVLRYEQHCVGQDLHRTVLAAVAMAEGDARLLDALLLPEPGIDNEERALRDLLALVRHRHTSLMKESGTELRLHDEPANFYRERMRRHRHEAWVRTLNERAVAHLLSRLEGPWSYHGSLEDLCVDDDFQSGAVRLTNHLFWMEEGEAWPWLTVRFVEGLGFSSELREGLLDVAELWRSDLKGIGRKRLQILRAAEDRPWLADTLRERRRLLEEDEKRGWLAETRLGSDRFAAERRAVRLWSAAEALSQEERLDEALTILEQAEPNVLPGSEFAQRLANLGLSLGYKFFVRAGKEDRRVALETCGLAVRLGPLSAQGHYELGAAYHVLKEYEKAVEHHRKAIELNPQDGDAWRGLGNSYSWLGDHEKSIEYYRKSIELNPQDSDAWRALGDAYSWLNDYEKSIEHHRKSIELNPQDSDAWEALGYDYSRLNDHDKAAEHHRRATELNPQSGDAWRALGVDFLLLGRYQEACDPIRRACEFAAENASTWAWSGYLAMLFGDLREAFSAFHKAGELDRQLGWPLRGWACGLYRNRELQAALSKAREAEILEPTKAPLTRLALQRLGNGSMNYDREEVSEKVARERSQLVDAQWLALQGSSDEALAKLGEAIAHTPDNAAWARFLPAFHDLRSDPGFIAMTRDAPGSSWNDFPATEQAEEVDFSGPFPNV